jgi:hypothetical protein
MRSLGELQGGHITMDADGIVVATAVGETWGNGGEPFHQ